MMGFLLIFNGGFMLISALISFINHEEAAKGILISGLLSIAIGGVSQFATKGFKKEIKKRRMKLKSIQKIAR